MTRQDGRRQLATGGRRMRQRLAAGFAAVVAALAISSVPAAGAASAGSAGGSAAKVVPALRA